MENKHTEQKSKKSTLLLLLSIFFLFNAIMMFRAGINTLYFKHDTSSDYTTVQATVTDLKPDKNAKPGTPPRTIPTFTFDYNGKKITREAPELTFGPGIATPAFRQGEKYSLWVHLNRGELSIPPRATLKETGRSQLITSTIFVVLAIVVWIIRSRQGARTEEAS